MTPLFYHLFDFALINLAVIGVGYFMIREKMIFQSWMLLAVSIIGVHLIFIYEHPVMRMLALIVTTFTAMKVVAVAKGYQHKNLTLSFIQWAIFAAGWMGMRAEPFETLGGKPLPGAWQMIRFGASRVVAGVLLIALAHGVVSIPLNKEFAYILVSAILLVGFSLLLHFGVLGISAGTWRLRGVNTHVLFKDPAKSTSLTEFWGKRWNVAFSEMTSITIFRPLRGRVGAAAALMIAFIFSGILHEVALSVPVNAGYGLPTLYFIIQATTVLVEKVLLQKKVAFLHHHVYARVWTLFWVIVPMPLLFHEQFIKQVLWPMAGLSGIY
ncbi:MAG: MBOAT family protein [Bacteroidota bacterium]